MAKKSKSAAHAAWRPDFRATDKLPDIKVVRTDFLLNLIAAFVAVALLGFLTYREYEAATMAARVETLEREIQELGRADKQYLAGSAAFTRDTKRLEEAVEFLHVPLPPVPWLLQVAQLQPPEGVLSSFEYRLVQVQEGSGTATKSRTIYRISLKGFMNPSKDKSPTQLIDEFQNEIRAMDYSGGILRTAKLETAERDPSLDRFVYTILVEVEPLPSGQR